MVLKGNFEQ